MAPPKALTFRLQKCAASVDEAALRDALAGAFDDISLADVHIRSLATTLGPGETPPTKTATLSFAKLPSVIEAHMSQEEWKIKGPSLDGTLILDTHFHGLTPLNDVEAQKHAYDCIAISGLGSHPFGSWQAKGSLNEGWMWIRDALPKEFPTIRVHLFGYNTKLAKSNSFQAIPDLASFLAESLKASDFLSPAAKPLIFLAHSLGGIVLKEALNREHQKMRHVAGAVFFGVPSRGMETQALMTMISGQPNGDLVRDLTTASDYLRRLDDRFFEVVRRGKLELFWAYETKTTPTVAEQADGSFARTGPEKVLVTKESATRGLYGTNSSESTFAIDENHSDMVKFRDGDANCRVVLRKLREICTAHEEASVHGSRARAGLGEHPVEMAEDRSLEDRKIAILKALHTSPYRDRKDRNPDRVPGTCEWFVTHERFRQWRNSESAAMLWVSADPGSGKSVLAKYLVDSELPTTESRTTCYFFFKDDFEDQRSAKDALSCILHQLFQNKKIFFSREIVKRFETYGERLTGSFAELWDLLLMVSRDTNAGEIVCILDALDECEDQARSELAQALCKFFSARNNFNLKFLLTSRPLGEIRREFQPLSDMPGLPVIRLEGESDTETEKIAKEIEVYIHARVQSIQTLLRLKPGEAGLLLRRLLSIPHRTYLWVYLTLDLVQNDIDIDRVGIDKATSLLPKTVDDAYERILAKSRNVGEARKLLSIVVAATRPLTLAEMDVALTLREDHRSYKDLDLKSKERFMEYVRDLCGLFVSVTDSKIYLLHQTAKSFLVQDGFLVAPQIGSTSRLLWKSSLRTPQCHHLLWKISTWHLRFTEFETTPLDDTKKLSQYLHDHLFLDYTARNWAVHFRQSGIQRDAATTESLLEVCNAKSLGSLTWFSVYWASAHVGFPRDFTTLMIASYFGIGPVVRKLLKGVDVGVNSRDGTYQRSALSWASENGFDDVVRLLIKGPKIRLKDMAKLSFPERAEINARDRNGRTPLSYAAWNGHTVIAGLLIKAGARVDLEDDIGGAPLSYAICSGNEAVTNILKKRSMVGSGDNIVHTLLFSAVKKGDEFVVKRLLGMDKGLDIDTKDYDGRSSLSQATVNGHEAIVQLLLATGKADIDSKDNNGRTALSWAARMGHEAIVQLLLAMGKADIDVKDNNGQTALLWAVMNGREAVVQLLLATGKADIDVKDNNGRTALSWAARMGHEAIVQLLLATGKADIDLKDARQGRTPLSWAAGKGHKAVVQLLLATGKVDIGAKDNVGQTPLSWAAMNGHEAVVQLLRNPLKKNG